MMRTLNKIMLIGDLGADPEVRYFPSGEAVARVRLATDEWQRAANGEPIQFTEWHNLVFLNKRAETARDHFKKGMCLYIEGAKRTRAYTGGDRVKRTIVEIIVSQVRLLDRRASPSTAAPEHANDASEYLATGMPTSPYELMDDDSFGHAES